MIPSKSYGLVVDQDYRYVWLGFGNKAVIYHYLAGFTSDKKNEIQSHERY